MASEIIDIQYKQNGNAFKSLNLATATAEEKEKFFYNSLGTSRPIMLQFQISWSGATGSPTFKVLQKLFKETLTSIVDFSQQDATNDTVTMSASSGSQIISLYPSGAQSFKLLLTGSVGVVSVDWACKF